MLIFVLYVYTTWMTDDNMTYKFFPVTWRIWLLFVLALDVFQQSV